MQVNITSRIVGVLVAVTLGGASPVGAQDATPWEMHRDAARVRYAQAEQLEQVEDRSAPGAYTDAARLFAQAADSVPAGKKRLALVEPLVRKALVAFAQARRLDPPAAPCPESVQGWLDDAVATCDAFLAVIDRSGGGRSKYADIVETRAGYQRDVETCAPPVAAEVSEPAPVAKVVPPPRVEPGPASMTRGSSVAPEPRGARDRASRWPDVGLWTSVSLVGLFGAAALGTGLARVREPFQGAAFSNILDAARASQSDADPGNDVSSAQSADMCALARGSGGGGPHNPEVAGQCDRFDALGKASLATGVLAGVSLVAVATFLGLKLRRGRGRHEVASRRIRLAPGPQRSFGLTFGGSF